MSVTNSVQQLIHTASTELTIPRQLLIALFAAFLGDWNQLLQVFIILMVLDYMSGLFKAYRHRQVNSYLGLLGVFKKLGYLIVISAFFQVGLVLGEPVLLKNAAIVIFIVNEFVSILENLDELSPKNGNYLPKGIIELAEKTIIEKTGYDKRMQELIDDRNNN